MENTEPFEVERQVLDILCPHCKLSLRKQVVIELDFKRANNQEGVLRMSPDPGDYLDVFTSPQLGDKEVVTMLCPHCKQSLNVTKENDPNEIVEMVVKCEDEVHEVHYISARFNEHWTVRWDGQSYRQYGSPNPELMQLVEARDKSKVLKKFAKVLVN